MSIIYGLAVYFVMWWIVLFAILPFGVKTAQEAGEPGVAGQATSAPQNPMLLQKAGWTTVVTTVLFLACWAVLKYEVISIDDLPGPNSPKEQMLSDPKG